MSEINKAGHSAEEPTSEKKKSKLKSERSGEKSEKKSKKGNKDAGAPEDDTQKISFGGTTYYRQLPKESKSGKEKYPPGTYLWVPEGKTVKDKDSVWIQKDMPNGSVAYAPLRDPTTVRWDLPDINDGKGADVVFVEKKKYDARKEWTESSKKTTRQLASQMLESLKKTTGTPPLTPTTAASAGTSASVTLTVEESTLLSTNVANQYMSENKKLDTAGEEWIRRKLEEDLSSVLATKKAYFTEQASTARKVAARALQEKLGVVRYVSGPFRKNDVENRGPAPSAPLPRESLKPPMSPLLPTCVTLSDPFYASRLNSPSLQRGYEESRLEATTFMYPGGGEIRVLCAVPFLYFNEESEMSTPFVAAIARDWTGAFCFFFIDDPWLLSGQGENQSDAPSVIAAYPLLGTVDVQPTTAPPSPPSSATGFNYPAAISIDDEVFTGYFTSEQQALWLRDALRMALSSMYREGDDNERIVAMRAYSVEFASSDVSFYPSIGRPVSAAVAVTSIMESDPTTSQRDLNKLYAKLRLCLRTVDGRDSVLREWNTVAGNALQISESPPFSVATKSLASKLAGVFDQVIMCPVPETNAALNAGVIKRLSLLTRKFNTDDDDGANDNAESPSAAREESISAHFNQIKTLCTLVHRVMASWSSREEVDSLPFEACFRAEENTDVWRQEENSAAQSRLKNAHLRNPPGIYLAMVCYCDDSILTDARGNLVSEVVVPTPSQEELNQLKPDSTDFQWLLRLGGNKETWAEDLSTWEGLFEKRGQNCFASRFINAATQMWKSKLFPSLGYIFDAPVVLKAVGSALILTVLRVNSRDNIQVGPKSNYEWRDIGDLEPHTYTALSLVCAENTRINFLSSRYRSCMRYLDAAVQYREAMDVKLEPRFYLGFYVGSVSAAGSLMLVPEANRVLPPLQKVSDGLPTLEQWRWMQSLNYRRKTTGSFGLPALPSSTLTSNSAAVSNTFEASFAQALNALELATGMKVQCLYDLDLFPLNEEQTMYAMFAVAYQPPSIRYVAGAGAGELSADGSHIADAPQAPQGLVPMTYKLCSLVNEAMMQRYWPVVYSQLQSQRNAALKQLWKSASPLSSDEALRSRYDGQVARVCSIDKYSMTASCIRQLVLWVESDGCTLVDKFIANQSSQEECGRLPVNDVVERAVAFRAASTDPHLYTFKAALTAFQERTHTDVDAEEFVEELRSIDHAVSRSAADRVAAAGGASSKKSTGAAGSGAVACASPLVLRGYDDVPNTAIDETARQVAVYELPCTLAEFIRAEAENASETAGAALESAVEENTAYETALEIVEDIVELALVAGEAAVQAAKEIDDAHDHVDDEDGGGTAARLSDAAPLLRLRKEAERAAWNDRCKFLEKWSEVFSGAEKSGESMGALRVDPSVASREPDALFYTGSSLHVKSAEDGVRICIGKATTTANQLQQLLQVANSAMTALELTQCLKSTGKALAKRDRFLGAENTSNIDNVSAIQSAPRVLQSYDREDNATELDNASDLYNDIARTNDDDAGAATVTLLSKSHDAFPVHGPIDPLRCLSLRSASGTIRYPTASSETVSVIADHLNAPNADVPRELQAVLISPEVSFDELFEVSFSAQVPLLALVSFSRRVGLIEAGQYYSNHAASKLRTVANGSFFFDYGVKDWLLIEQIGGREVKAPMDVLWWIRYGNEAAASTNDADDFSEYENHAGDWKQMYAETRIRVLLSYGVSTLEEDEVELWLNDLGPCVEYLSFRDKAGVSDAEVSLLVNTCPNLVSLDISHTGVTDEGARLIIGGLNKLQECSVEGCNVSQALSHAIEMHCAKH